jgi:hypothetical protein
MEVPKWYIYPIIFVGLGLMLLQSCFENRRWFEKIDMKIDNIVDWLSDMIEEHLFDYKFTAYDEMLERKWRLFGFRMVKRISCLIRRPIIDIDKHIEKAQGDLDISKKQHLVVKLSGI